MQIARVAAHYDRSFPAVTRDREIVPAIDDNLRWENERVSRL